MQFFKRYSYVYVMVFLAVCALTLFTAERVAYIREVSAPKPVPLPVIVLDPGHGGEDGGAVSCSGKNESEFNLEIALRTYDLCSLLGMNVKMIRTQDEAVYSGNVQTLSEKKVSDLHNRVRIVNETPGALLVSIHQNSFPEERYAGAQVFYADTDGSRELAELMQEKLCLALDPENHRQCKKSSSVYLMEHIRCTGILVECGFLTNRAEEARLKTPEYQKQLACTITAALCEYLHAEEPVV